MRVLIASSATGGHIYPALAVAEEIVRRDPAAEMLFVGAKWEIGKDIVEASGYKQVFIEAAGFDRKSLIKNIAVLAKLAKSSGEIKRILKGFNPDVCIGTGGHVSGPVIRVAKKLGTRTILMEQNVIPGLANKIAEKYADRVFVAFDDTAGHFKDAGKVVVSGNPVRAAFAETAPLRAQMREKYGVPDGAFCVLVFGGSQGADAMNDAGAGLIERFAGKEDFFIILISGRQLYEQALKKLSAGQAIRAGGYAVLEYSDKIYELFAAADLIVSRAGALTVTEIAHSAKASILVPSPNVTNNHQFFNAKALADAGAATLITEWDMKAGSLADLVMDLAADPVKLKEMGMRAAETVKANAAEVIVNEVFGN